MSNGDNGSTGIVAGRLRLGAGFGARDRDQVIALISSLDRHLAHWNADRVDLEISVKDRDGPEQKVTLEAWLPGWPPLVTTSVVRELDHALVDVRKDMIRQIEDEKAKRNLRKPRTTRKGP